MRQIYITFSGAIYDETTRRIMESAPRFGASDVWIYDDRWLLEQDFYVQNQWFWTHPHKRGFGWYVWKPFVIWDALARASEGDVILYTDADTYPIADLSVLFTRCRQDGGIMLFASENHVQGDWCKRDCFISMGQDELFYWKAPAGVARFALFQKGPWKVTQFLMEWLTYSVNPLCNTFDPSVLREEVPGFTEHRAEQSVLTNLAHKYGLGLYREACQAGNGASRDQDLYGQLFRQENTDTQHETSEPSGSAYAKVPHA